MSGSRWIVSLVSNTENRRIQWVGSFATEADARACASIVGRQDTRGWGCVTEIVDSVGA